MHREAPQPGQAWHTGGTHLLRTGQRQREMAIGGKSTYEVIAELEYLQRRKVLTKGKYIVIREGIR